MSARADLGALYMWARAGDRELTLGFRGEKCRVSLCEAGQIPRVWEMRDTMQCLEFAGIWARVDMADAAKAKRRAKP